MNHLLPITNDETLKRDKGQSLRTPIEIALQIDEDGHTTARALYEFLELGQGQFSRWSKTNIEKNEFYEENVDWWGLDIVSNGNNCKDYKLTTDFAKHLCMESHSSKGKIARQYFITVEDKAKEFVINKIQNKAVLGLQFVKFIADDLRVAESSRLFMYENYCKDVGIPTGFLPKYEDNGNRERLPATELLKMNGCGISAVKFNQLLLKAGYLEEKERASSKGGAKKYKALTDKGLQYGVNLISDKNQKETQPYYYSETFMELYNSVI